MRLPIIIISAVIFLFSFLSGCSGTSSELGEDVTLAVGQTAMIEGGKLNIKFIEVKEDSRCPRNVTCIWQGQAVYSLQIKTRDGAANDLEITEPGLIEGFIEVISGDYKIYTHLTPYPEKAGEIAKDEYRLVLAGYALKTPVDTKADVTGFITNVQMIAEKDIVGRISVESHADKIVDKYVITVNRKTGLFQQEGDRFKNITFNQLENQQWIKLWFAGPVMESYPMQATARQIVITE
jgi:hypothetical protein